MWGFHAWSDAVHSLVIQADIHMGSAERTVALLAFEDVKASPVGDLMDTAQRQKTASELNAAILSSQNQVAAGTLAACGLHPSVALHGL